MAVLSAVPGIRVTITSGGSTLQEYADDDNEFIHSTLQASKDRISTVYIECVDNAPFEIFYEVFAGCSLLEERHNELSFGAYVDGKPIGYTSTRNLARGWSRAFKEALSRPNDHQMVYQTLKFNTILRLDDVDTERFKKDKKAAEGLGEILVCVRRSKELNTPRDAITMSPFTSVTDLSEKALKGQAISHGATFGKKVVKSRALENKRIYPDGWKTPLAIFRFKYRSREALQQELVIPRTPSPAPAPEPDVRDIQARDACERIARLMREIEEIKAESKFKREAPALKPEIEEIKAESKIKREAPADDNDVEPISSTPSKRLKIRQK